MTLILLMMDMDMKEKTRQELVFVDILVRSELFVKKEYVDPRRYLSVYLTIGGCNAAVVILGSRLVGAQCHSDCMGTDCTCSSDRRRGLIHDCRHTNCCCIHYVSHKCDNHDNHD